MANASRNVLQAIIKISTENARNVIHFVDNAQYPNKIVLLASKDIHWLIDIVSIHVPLILLEILLVYVKVVIALETILDVHNVMEQPLINVLNAILHTIK